MLPVVAIVGKSGTGKTVIMEKLVAEFKKRGYRVAAVKHAHQAVELDVPGKDTWRFSQAGSDASVVCSPMRVTIFRNLDREPRLEEAVLMLGSGYDIVLAEGFKNNPHVPKIEVCPSGDTGEMICRESEIKALISDGQPPVKVPVFGREETGKIADFIEYQVMAALPPDMAIEVNGRAVPLKRFVRDIMGSSILAMLGTLKTVGIIRTASIQIRSQAGKSDV